nr:BTB/POZ domain-containing protein [Mimivirus sp.]
MRESKLNCYIVVKMSPLSKLFQKTIKEIPLSNIFLMANFVELSDKLNIIDDKNSLIQVPINLEIKTNPMLYIYEKTHICKLPIEDVDDNTIYNTSILPLDKYGYIKDLFFVIIEEKNSETINEFSNSLIEFEILYLTNNPQNEKIIVPHIKLDSIMSNHYIPLKKLGHKLSAGIYYYSFSSDPNCSKMLGGLDGKEYVIRFKTKKIKGHIRIYINEYYRMII